MKIIRVVAAVIKAVNEKENQLFLQLNVAMVISKVVGSSQVEK